MHWVSQDSELVYLLSTREDQHTERERGEPNPTLIKRVAAESAVITGLQQNLPLLIKYYRGKCMPALPGHSRGAISFGSMPFYHFCHR